MVTVYAKKKTDDIISGAFNHRVIFASRYAVTI